MGTDDGLIWRTQDEGREWKNVTPAGLEAWSKVGIIDAPDHTGHAPLRLAHSP